MPERSTFNPEVTTPQEREPIFGSVLSKDQLVGYKQWKQEVPVDLRSLVEGHLLGRHVRVDKNDLPSAVEFHRGLQQMLEDPYVDTSTLGLSSSVQKQFTSLQKMKIGEEQVNLFAALADPDIGFDVKANYVRTKLLPRLEFLRARDERLMRETIEKGGGTDVTGEDEEEEYSPHRGPEQEKGEGLPSEAVATVFPFYGGYFMDDVYDRYDPATLTWKKSPRRMSEVGEQHLDSKRRRVYRSRLKNGRGKVKLPRGWGVDIGSIEGLVEHDQDGIVRVRMEDDASGEFSIQAAPSQDALTFAMPEGEVEEISDAFPEEVFAFAQEAMQTSIPEAAKVRRIASFIHKHLEYDKDPKWEAVYKADSSRYFEAIWENKKAKCDEANSLLVRLLTKVGVHARFISGHSVRTQSETGEAMLHGIPPIYGGVRWSLGMKATEMAARACQFAAYEAASSTERRTRRFSTFRDSADDVKLKLPVMTTAESMTMTFECAMAGCSSITTGMPA